MDQFCCAICKQSNEILGNLTKFSKQTKTKNKNDSIPLDAESKLRAHKRSTERLTYT